MNLDQIDFAGILTRVVAAAVILIITFVLAKLLKNLLGTQLTKVTLLQRHDDNGQSLGQSLGTIASLIVWLFGLIAVLNVFGLTQATAPIQDLLNGVLSVLPGIIGAALVFFVGFVLAKIVRQIVETALRSAGADHWMERVGGGSATSATSSQTTATFATTEGGARSAGSSTPALSSIAGQLVFALIIIVVGISALQVLGIDAIAQPATQMLSLILNAIPLIIAAALLLGLGYLISRFVAPLTESTLHGLGTDLALADLGLGRPGGISPSRAIAKVVQLAIVLFFAIAATRVLGFPEITAILDTILQIGGGIVLGGAIIAVGVLVANLAPRLVSGQAGQVIRWGAIVLFVAIGLRSMGLADTIVNLAFGALVIGAAAAGAIAFGLAGREAAADQLAKLQRNLGSGSGSSDAAATAPSTTAPSAGVTPTVTPTPGSGDQDPFGS